LSNNLESIPFSTIERLYTIINKYDKRSSDCKINNRNNHIKSNNKNNRLANKLHHILVQVICNPDRQSAIFNPSMGVLDLTEFAYYSEKTHDECKLKLIKSLLSYVINLEINRFINQNLQNNNNNDIYLKSKEPFDNIKDNDNYNYFKNNYEKYYWSNYRNLQKKSTSLLILVANRRTASTTELLSNIKKYLSSQYNIDSNDVFEEIQMNNISNMIKKPWINIAKINSMNDDVTKLNSMNDDVTKMRKPYMLNISIEELIKIILKPKIESTNDINSLDNVGNNIIDNSNDNNILYNKYDIVNESNLNVLHENGIQFSVDDINQIRVYRSKTKKNEKSINNSINLKDLMRVNDDKKITNEKFIPCS
jgi:hypothetical protein